MQKERKICQEGDECSSRKASSLSLITIHPLFSVCVPLSISFIFLAWNIFTTTDKNSQSKNDIPIGHTKLTSILTSLSVRSSFTFTGTRSAYLRFRCCMEYNRQISFEARPGPSSTCRDMYHDPDSQWEVSFRVNRPSRHRNEKERNKISTTKERQNLDVFTIKPLYRGRFRRT